MPKSTLNPLPRLGIKLLPEGILDYIQTEDRKFIRYGYWEKGDRGTVIILPGRTEYIEKYNFSFLPPCGPYEYDAENSRYIEDYDEDCEGKGYASQCMKQLADLADQLLVTLTLEPSAFNEDPQQKRPDTNELASWYQRLGFVYDPDEHTSMIREPAAK